MNKLKIKKIDHLVITTVNAEMCFEFYRKIGFDVHEVGQRVEMFAGDFKINVHYYGNELEPHARHIRTGSADICFEIEGSIQDVKEHLIAQSIDYLDGIVVRHGTRGEMKSIYIRDPDGNLLEFSEY